MVIVLLVGGAALALLVDTVRYFRDGLRDDRDRRDRIARAAWERENESRPVLPVGSFNFRRDDTR